MATVIGVYIVNVLGIFAQIGSHRKSSVKFVAVCMHNAVQRHF